MAQTVVGRVTTIIDADNSRLLAKIKQSTSKLNELSKFKTSISLDLDNKSFSSKISDSSKEISKLGDKKLSLDANNQSLVNKISDSAKEISKLGDKKVSLDANNQSLVNKISDSAKEINKLSGKKVSIDADNKSLISKVTDSFKAIGKLSGKEIILTAKSKIDSKIRGINNSLKSLKGKSILLTAKDNIKAIVNKGVNSIKRLKNKSVLLSVRDQVSAKVTKLFKKVNSLKGKTIPINVKTANANKKIEDLGNIANKTRSSLRGMVKGISFAAISAGVLSLTKKILDLTIAAEQTEVAFQSLLGSDVAGSRLFNQIIQLAAVTPFTSSKLNEAAKTLLAFGTEGEEVVGVLRQIGDVSAATGADIRNLALVFGQIKSTGKLMGQDLNQLINAGFNPLQMISEKTGKSMSDLKDDMAAGLITFDQVEDAFKDATSEGGKFFKMMERQSATVGGKLSTLKDNLQQIARNLGDMSAPALSNIVTALNKVAESIKNVTAGEGTTGEKAAVGAGTIGLGALIGTTLAGPLRNIIKTISNAIFENFGKKLKSGFNIFGGKLFGTFFGRLKGVFESLVKFGKDSSSLTKKTLGILSSVILKLVNLGAVVKSLSFVTGSLIAAIAAVGVAIGVFISKINSLNKAVRGLKASEVTGKAVKPGAEGLSFGEDKEVTPTFFDSFIAGIKNIPRALLGVGKLTLNIIKGLADAILNILPERLSSTIKGVGNAFLILFPQIKNFGQAILELGKVFKKVRKFFVAIFDIFKQIDLGKFIETIGLKDLAEDVSVGLADVLTFGKFSEMMDSIDEEISIGADRIKGTEEAAKARARAQEGISRKLKKRAEEAIKKAEKEAKEVADFFNEGYEKYLEALFPHINIQMNIMDAETKLEKILKKDSQTVQDAIFDLQEMMNEAANNIPEDIAAGISDIEGEVPDIFKGIDFRELFAGDMSPAEIISQIPAGSLPSFVDILAKILEKPLMKLKEGFSDFGAEIDISDAISQIENNKEEFSKAFEKFADKDIFKGMNNIGDALKKIPEELIPDFVSLLEKTIGSADSKIKARFQKFSSTREIKEATEDILANKIKYEPLLVEFGFDSFEQAFLEIPKKMLPEFRDLLKNAIPTFSDKLSQIIKNLDISEAKIDIDALLKEGKFNELLNKDIIKNQDVTKVLRDFVSQAPEESLPEILGLINRFFPQPQDTVKQLAPAAFKGSVEAFSILAKDRKTNEKQIEKNTNLAAEFLKQIKENLDDGVNFKNVGVAK